MKKLLNWIKGHQLISFFILTFLATWGLGFSYGAVLKQGKFFVAPLAFIATCGPALAGIIITVIANPQKKSEGNSRNAWIVFFAAWIPALHVLNTDSGPCPLFHRRKAASRTAKGGSFFCQPALPN
jgi:hypothetical protein